MSRKNWFLILCVFLPALALAAGDYRYTVPESQFEADVKIPNASGVCLDTKSPISRYSEKPRYPLESGKLYLRSKLKGNRYGWYSGTARAECFKKLYAFNLHDNRLSVLDASRLRFYADRFRKPFQDESEIYFDKKFLYSSRVENLYLMRNGKWQKLLPAALSGIAVVEGVPDSSIVVHGQSSFRAPVVFSPVDTGLFHVTLFMPGMYPTTSGIHISSGKTSYLKPIYVPQDTTVYPIETSVTEEKIQAAKNLFETEVLYDTFIEDLNRMQVPQGTAGFDSLYPQPKNPPRGMSRKNPQYTSYLAAFDAARSRARSQWLSRRLSKILALNTALFEKLDSLGRDTVSLRIVPQTVQKKDSTYEILFLDSAKRVDVLWNGKFPDSDTADVRDGATFELVFENRPVWKYDGFRVKSRHLYRFLKLSLVKGDSLVSGTGSFTLPAYIRVEDEVQDWLLSEEEVLPVASVARVLPDSAAKDSEDVTRAFAKIDSGTFYFKKRMVKVAPFYIRKTEVTVGEYRSLVKKPPKFTFGDSLFPAHNVSWKDANLFCRQIGGRLPTETEWEYAARAGKNENFVWEEKRNAKAFEYAVFRTNSPARVASRKPNAFGLYDVAGNVAEWTANSYSFFLYERVFKGGSWKSAAEEDLDLTERSGEDPRYWSDWIGFRCVVPITK